MFVHYFIQVDRPFHEAKRAVLGSLDGLADAAGVAYREGEKLRMRAGLSAAAAKTVELEVGVPLDLSNEISLPIRWYAIGPASLFPTMEAELRLSAIGPTMTQITFNGSYQPPLGGVGELLDKAVLHRLAEATVKRFVDRIGVAVDQLT